MKKDIENADDIAKIVKGFYAKVNDDQTIGYIFKTVGNFSFESHIPTMISFWETLLFGVAGYKGNPMIKHLELHKTIPLKTEHFAQWINLWEETIRENYEGKNAIEAIAKAKSIAALMQYKINGTWGIQDT